MFSNSKLRLPTRENRNSFFLGIAVIFLYGVCVFTVFAGFGSYIFRGEWVEILKAEKAQSGSDEINTELERIIFNIKRKVALQEQITGQDAQYLKATAVFETFDAGYSASLAADIQFGAQVIGESREFVRSLTNIAGVESTDFLLELDQIEKVDLGTTKNNEKAFSIVRSIPLPQDAEASVRTAFSAEMDRFRSRQAKLRVEFQERKEESHVQRAGKTQASNRVDVLAKARNASRLELAELKKEIATDGQHEARYAALYFKVPIPFIGEYIGTSFQRLAGFPTIFLTLIVTMAAGALGTVVAFSKRYTKGGNTGVSMSRLFVNLGEGIAAAIAIFLFSGAGMLALSQGGGTSNGVELSPYTVAFVAFLSGFMAEDAFASIEMAGRRVFSNTDQRQADEAERLKADAEAKIMAEMEAETKLKDGAPAQPLQSPAGSG